MLAVGVELFGTDDETPCCLPLLTVDGAAMRLFFKHLQPAERADIHQLTAISAVDATLANIAR